MESCWLINFEDGQKAIISEELYEFEASRNWGGRARISEEHWFSLSECRRKNQGVLCAGVNPKNAPKKDDSK